jgi:hypothetical protein
MADVSEQEGSALVGATPEVIHRHYEKMDRRVPRGATLNGD